MSDGTVLVAGLINLEVTLRVERFPVDYNPVNYPFFGVNSTVSGVGYNVAKALRTLGEPVVLLSLVGNDDAGALVRHALGAASLPEGGILSDLAATPHSVILYDSTGRRSIHVDLKDIQERAFPQDVYEQMMQKCELAVLCNVNFTRPFLRPTWKAGKLIATDVHAVAELEDEYNRDYMMYAHILFMSHERLPCEPETWAWRVANRYGNEIIVIGLGEQGALLWVKRDGFMERVPAAAARPVVNTIGAGDALFAAFLHSYRHNQDPYEAVRKAVVFASYKIGAVGAADGFLSGDDLDALYARLTA